MLLNATSSSFICSADLLKLCYSRYITFTFEVLQVPSKISKSTGTWSENTCLACLKVGVFVPETLHFLFTRNVMTGQPVPASAGGEIPLLKCSVLRGAKAHLTGGKGSEVNLHS